MEKKDTKCVIEVINKVGQSTDEKNWRETRAQFLDEAFIDYSSLTQVPGAKIPTDQLIQAWADALGPVQYTKHTITDHEVKITGDQAFAKSRFHAVHTHPVSSGGDTWVVSGRYEHELKRVNGQWKISTMKLLDAKQTGNLNLLNQVRGQTQVNRYRYQPGVNQVSFQSQGQTLRGNLYLPADYKDGEKLPVVIVTGSWTTVKEQMSGIYARKISENGFAALAFDFRGFGESEGTPRQYESAREKEKDIQSAIDFVSRLPILDHDRIGALSICATSGYMADVAGRDLRIKSLTLVAPWLHNRELVETIYGGKAGVDQKIQAAMDAKTVFEKTGHVLMVPAVSTTDTNAAMFGDFDYYLNPKRGAIPEWKNEFAVMSWEDWLTFDGVQAARGIKIPVLLVHSHNGAVPQGAEQFYAGLKSKKNIVWLDGTQFDFYDQEKHVQKSIALAAQHFTETL